MARLAGGWSALLSEVSASWVWMLRAYQRLPTSAVSFIPRLDCSSFDSRLRSQGLFAPPLASPHQSIATNGTAGRLSRLREFPLP